MRVRTNRARVALRLILTLAIAGLGAVLAAAPVVAAQCDGGGAVNDDGGEVIGECNEDTPGQPGSSSVSEVWSAYCASAVGAYQAGDSIEYVRSEPLTDSDIEHHGLDPSGDHWWWLLNCVRDGVAVHGVEILVTDDPGVPPEVVRDRAAARINPPAPAPVSSPPMGEATFVAVPTWLWLDPSGWVPIEVSEAEGLVSVTVRATPVRATWEMGNGDLMVCHGPGTEWRPGLGEDATDCSYTYTTASYAAPEGVFSGSVTVSWDFEWWLNGAAQGSFGSVDVASGFEVAVAEVQGIETEG